MKLRHGKLSSPSRKCNYLLDEEQGTFLENFSAVDIRTEFETTALPVLLLKLILTYSS